MWRAGWASACRRADPEKAAARKTCGRCRCRGFRRWSSARCGAARRRRWSARFWTRQNCARGKWADVEWVEVVLMQAEGLPEISRRLERERKPPVGWRMETTLKGSQKFRVGVFLHPFRDCFQALFRLSGGFALLNRPGYLLATLRVGKAAQIEFVLIGEIRVCILARSENA